MYRVKEDARLIELSNEVQEMVFQLIPLMGLGDMQQVQHYLEQAKAVMVRSERRKADRRDS